MKMSVRQCAGVLWSTGVGRGARTLTMSTTSQTSLEMPPCDFQPEPYTVSRFCTVLLVSMWGAQVSSMGVGVFLHKTVD